MSGARHITDESGKSGKSDTPYSYGPNPIALLDKQKASAATRQDESTKAPCEEPKPGKELDFN